MPKQYYLYIMTNPSHTVQYTGVTNNLKRRVCEHKEKMVRGFTSRYNINQSVYYEIFSDARSAILREKQIKAGSRAKKVALITQFNKQWKDLFGKL